MAKKAPLPAATPPEAAAKQSYYLQRAHIKDFRSIRDAAVEFKPGLNIIIGPNGSGKTNFVECIQNGLDKISADFDGSFQLFISGPDSFKVRFDLNGDEDTAYKQLYALNREAYKQLTFLSDIGAEFKSDSFHHAQLMSKRTAAALVTNEHFLRLVTILHGIPTRYPIVNVPEDFYLSTRVVGMNIYDSSLFAQTFASNISSILLTINRPSKVRELPSHEEVRHAIKQVDEFYSELLTKYLKQFTTITSVRLSAHYNTYTNSVQQQINVKGIILEFKIGNDWLPFSALSSGTQRLFYITSEIIGSYYYLPRHSINELNINNKIILLEEPELGIHPDQLERLLVFLREQSKKHQIIITTHSPQVLDMLREDELDRITICELHKTKGTQFRKLKKAQIAAAKQYMSAQGLYLSDYWRYGSLESVSH